MEVPAIGDLVFVEGYGNGEVTYIDYKNLYVNHQYPIQVTLENPYDNHSHYVIRTNLKEIKIGGK